MASIEQLKEELIGLKDQVDTLQGAIDSEQAQIAEVISKLEALLEAAQNAGVPDEILTQISEIKAAVEAARADISGTIPDEPES